MKTNIKLAAAAIAVSAALSGCATTGGGYYGGAPQGGYPQAGAPAGQQSDYDKTRRNAAIGAAVGAVAGLLSGNDATERRQRAMVGAGVGGLAGGAVGAYQDRQERVLRDRMQGTGVEVVRQGDNITLNMPEAITFGFDQSNLQSQFYPVLDRLANTLQEYNQTIVEVAGHTDSKGTDQYNQALSMRRAESVSSYLMSRGLMRDRFIVTGAGESRPVATNDTEMGRAQNRRVEITLVPLRG
ncbi:OmpA family protein [Cognatilysobacter bugurensis]|uniref:Cell envelope biogenesis protein OmpA n=1 Tax=Cognatilysobacter bugurensis TaxID=543356 RepID=A0A918W5V8_9GAMM|nr:OmpA family protein [Lysobacter bugurensis]GHA71905.1 cell envelope biogenesis protein OmpA [Lysobacter bugurensis]